MKIPVFLIISSFFVISCIKDKKTTWDTEILAPIVKSELTVSDILKSEYIITNSDSSLKLVYASDFFSMNTDSFVNLPDSTFEIGASLRTLELPDYTINEVITFGQVLRNINNPALTDLINQAYAIAEVTGNDPIIPFGNGSTQTFSAGGETFEILMGDLFDEIILDTGSVEITLDNNTKYDVTNIVFQLENTPLNSETPIGTTTFDSLPAGSTISNTISLSDKTINSELIGLIQSLDLNVVLQAGQVIDTNEFINASIVVKDIKAKEATAIWPDQNVIDEISVVPFGNDLDIELKDATIREGSIYFEIYSSLVDSIYLTFEVLNVVKPATGIAFKIDTVIPPAEPGGISSMSNTYSINGYHFDFNGEGYLTPGESINALLDDSTNAYVTHLTARIQNTGSKKTISLDDTVFVKAQVKELKPSFARGYLGNQMINAGPSSLKLDLFNKIKSGQINLEDVDFEIEVDNGIGASAEARFSKISGINDNNNRVDLTFTPGNEVMQINSASYNGENNRTTHNTSSKTLTKSNSSIDKFIENFPSTLEYELEVELNHGEIKPLLSDILNPDDPPNFIHYEDDIKARLNMEVPLSIIADSLVLIDTLDFNLTDETGEDVESGKFKLLVDNGFPLDANTSIYFMDDMGLIIDSLWSRETILRADVNGTGRVTSKKRTVINFNISKEKMDIIKVASKVYIVAGFHTYDLTSSEKTFYRIYSDYSFGVKLVGDFKYQFSN